MTRSHVGATTDKKAIKAFLDKLLEVAKARPDLQRLGVPEFVEGLRLKLRRRSHDLSLDKNGSLLIGDYVEIKPPRKNT